MNITKEMIAFSIVQFFVEKKNFSTYRLGQITAIDSKTLDAWKNEERKSIRQETFDTLVSKLQNHISVNYKEFADFLVEKFANHGISGNYIKKIFETNRNVMDAIDLLLRPNIFTLKALQEKIGVESIVQTLKTLLSPYGEYFQVSDTAPDNCYSSLFDNNQVHHNYLILNFPNAYHVGIFFFNYETNYEDKIFSYKIKEVKTHYKLNMLLFVTDIDEKRIPFSIQTSLVKTHNLFWEFVNEDDLQKITIQGLELPNSDDINNLQELIICHKYAQLIFEKFMSCLSVISNEIVFQPYLKKINRELDVDSDKLEEALKKILILYTERSNISNFTGFVKEFLLKEICNYSYLSRHTIYHERTLIVDKVEALLKSNKKDKLNLAVEICAPNSLTTCEIIEKCEKLLLFTASHNAYSIMNTLEEKSGGRFLPPNVSLHLSHSNPEYMMHQFENELTGKVDLLVIGYGAGSQISDLTCFVRYAYNWLSENGILFISVYNKEAIVLNKFHINDQRFESSPLYISDYWTYTLREEVPLLRKLKAYSLENLKSTHLSLFDKNDNKNIKISTYPYISALINPSDYPREILDEIRKADKMFAQDGTHGQLINVFAQKTKNSNVERTTSKIKKYLKSLDINYCYYNHTISPDSKSLNRSLQAQNKTLLDTTLLKTVVLQKKSSKSEYEDSWIYVILPYNKMVAYESANYELVPENFVIQRFNQGTISPLAVILEKEKIQSNERIYFLYNESVKTTYVIMSGGSNSNSVRIKTKDFKKIVDLMDIRTKEVIE